MNTISTRKVFWIVVGVAVATVVVTEVWAWRAYLGAPIKVENTQSALSELAQDVYPLYDKAEWSAPVAEAFNIATFSYSGLQVNSRSVIGTMDPASVFAPFASYYDQKLKSLGWKEDNGMAAGGPMGGQTGYRKGNALILTRFSILYHNVTDTAPSECPCDITLSIFSTK